MRATKPIIINMTSSPANDYQLAMGVVDLTGEEKQTLMSLISYETGYVSKDMLANMQKLVELARHTKYHHETPDNVIVMIGGYPIVRLALRKALKDEGIMFIDAEFFNTSNEYDDRWYYEISILGVTESVSGGKGYLDVVSDNISKKFSLALSS